MRTQAHRIIKRAGLIPWPKTFQNLRSSRQTELAETFPIQCVCAWIGNSTEIARKHYLQVTDAHWEKATKAQQNPQQQAAASACNGLQSPSADSAENSAYGAEDLVCSGLPSDAEDCKPLSDGNLGRGGIRTHESRICNPFP